jgi:hypothetical protein
MPICRVLVDKVDLVIEHEFAIPKGERLLGIERLSETFVKIRSPFSCRKI